MNRKPITNDMKSNNDLNIHAYFTKDNVPVDNNEFLSEVMYTLTKEEDQMRMAGFSINNLKQVMLHDAKSIIGNLIDDTITEVCENYSLMVLRQGHKDIHF